MRPDRLSSLAAVALVGAVVAVAVLPVASSFAQDKKGDPFGDIDLNALKKNGTAPQTVPAPVRQPPALAGQRRISDPLLLKRTDPIGSLTKTATFDRVRKIYVGKSQAGTIACYAREEGDTHRLDIGIAAQGAFIRLATPEPREKTPVPPVRVFAGKEKTKRVGNNEYATGEFTVLKSYDGDVEFYVPEPTKGGFTVITRSDPAAFLAMLAGAKTEFVVVQSIADPKAINIVAIYHFSTGMVPALLSCAKANITAAAPVASSAPVEVTASPEGWTAYTNPRFGTSADYPAGIFSERDPAPENGDGQSFHSRDNRARLSIYGTYNVEADTPQSYVDKYVDQQGVTFRRVTKNFYVISGIAMAIFSISVAIFPTQRAISSIV